MSQGAVIGVLVCAIVIGLSVGTLIGALCLRAAVAIYNKIAGGASSSSSVPEPTFGKSLWITFSTSVVQIVVGLLINGLFLGGRGAQGRGTDLGAEILCFCVGFLIMVRMLSERLPTTFGRAFLVTLCELVLILFVTGVLVAVGVFAFGVALRRG